jgi:ribosome production factor 2
VQVEDGKRILLLQGNKTSQTGKDVLADLFKLKKGEAAKLSRKNDIWPFEPGNEVSLQFFCERADCALFCLANHNKKRPHNLVLGRMFNAQLLDMLELGVTQHVPIATFAGAAHVQAGAKVRMQSDCILPFACCKAA